MGDKNRKHIRSHSSRTGLPLHSAPSKDDEKAKYLRMSNAGRSKRKPSLVKMPWEKDDGSENHD